jgi:L-alanine-DL-glutamate epimerase-like enolase superfamily enzyme
MVAVLEAAKHAHALGLNINLAGKVAETSISGNAVSILSCLVPNINWDVSITNQYLEVDPVSESLTIDKGRVRAPKGLGLGTEVDLDILKPFIKSHYS